MPVLSLACHLPHNTPNIPSRYNNEQTTKQTKAINNSYIYISHVNVTQTVPDISPLMPMHQDPLLVTSSVPSQYYVMITNVNIFDVGHTWVRYMCGTSPLALGWHITAILWVITSWRFIIMVITKTSTHWSRDIMAAIFQTTFSNGFSWMKMYEFG